MVKAAIEFCRRCGHSIKVNPTLIVLAIGSDDCREAFSSVDPEEWVDEVIKTNATFTKAGLAALKEPS